MSDHTFLQPTARTLHVLIKYGKQVHMIVI